MKRKLQLLSLLFVTVIAFAQETNKFITEIIPPPPSVNNLMKFEEIPVSHYTGVPDISIPIANISTGLKNIDLPIRLGYHTLNVKPKDRAGEIGIGWSLFAGGTISRTVVDLPDEIETVSMSSVGTGSASHKYGIYLDESSGGSSQNVNYMNDFIIAQESYNTLLLQDEKFHKMLYEGYFHNRFDTSYDLYQYSFLHYTGRFIIKKINGILTPVKLDKNNLKIICNHTLNTITSFDIINDEGVKFTFNIKEVSENYYFNYSQNIFSGDNINQGSSTSFTSSYHLATIKNLQNQDVVQFQYYPEKEISIDSNIQINRTYHQPLSHSVDEIPSANSSLPKKWESNTSYIKTKTRQVSNILIIDKGRITFDYSYDREDQNYGSSNIGNLARLSEVKVFNNANQLLEKHILIQDYSNNFFQKKRLTLKELQKFDKDNNLIYTYKLDYHLPPYTGAIVVEDEWKYSKCNDDYGPSYREECVQAGQLKTLKTPTNGKVQFNYEVNTYSYQPDADNFSPQTIEITNFDKNELNWNNASTVVSFTNFSFTNKYAFTLDHTSIVKFNFNFDVLNQNGYSWQLSLYKNGGSTILSTGPGLGSGNSNDYILQPTELSPGSYYFQLVNYGSGSNANFDVSVLCNFKYKNLNNYKFLEGGGVRIKSLKYYDSMDDVNNTVPIKSVSFSYDDPSSYNQNHGSPIGNNDFGRKSTGALVFPKPMYSYNDFYKYSFLYGGPDFYMYSNKNYEITTFSTENFLSVQKTKGGDVGYKLVTQKEEGKGKILYTFSSPIDFPNLELPSFRPPFLPAENYDHRRGNLLSKKNISENGSLLSEEKFKYSDNFYHITTGILHKFLPQTFGDEFFYGSIFSLFEEYKNAHDHANIVIKGQMHYNHPYRVYCLAMSKNPHNFISTYLKKEIVGKSNVIEHELISYFPNQDSLKTFTSFVYNDRDYPTEKKTVFPSGEVDVTTYSYAHDKGNQYLIDKNMIGIPLETITTKKKNAGDTGKVISHVKTEYPTSQAEADTKTSGLPLPYEVLSKDLQNTNMTKEVTYTKYDPANGNLQEYKIKDQIPVAIIWGYNSTQPIAKIEGATYADVQNLATAIMNASNTDAAPPSGITPEQAEIDLQTALDTFRRTPALANFQITTYTYDPLIGVRSITPPSGIREYYFYDTANRLEFIKTKDEAGNFKILKEFKYNYKQ